MISRRHVLPALALLHIPAVIQARPKRKGKSRMKTATGAFEVKSTPLPFDGKIDSVALGRMKFDKQFTGALVATSTVEMLSAVTQVKGSAAYVALEWMTGTLDGKKGTFVMHHTGVMDKGAQSLSIKVVPDSGTGELAGLTGELRIEIRDGKHFYTFNYELAA
jgi:hypothetical protein